MLSPCLAQQEDFNTCGNTSLSVDNSSLPPSILSTTLIANEDVSFKIHSLLCSVVPRMSSLLPVTLMLAVISAPPLLLCIVPVTPRISMPFLIFSDTKFVESIEIFISSSTYLLEVFNFIPFLFVIWKFFILF